MAFQRLDAWLWCARLLKARADCARLAQAGAVRINRQPTDKPHARVRPGDVLTLHLRGRVLVVRVLALAARRGPAAQARGMFEELAEPAAEPAPAPAAGPDRPALLHRSANGCISPPFTGFDADDGSVR